MTSRTRARPNPPVGGGGGGGGGDTIIKGDQINCYLQSVTTANSNFDWGHVKFDSWSRPMHVS